MFFESFLINLSVLLVLILALIFDYVTKFFSYWYVRHIPYKTSIPFIGSDYHRVFGIRSTTEDVNNLYSQHPRDKFAGRIKSRIPDLIVRNPDVIKRMLSTDFTNFHSRGLGLDKSQDVCLRNNLFYADGEKWTLLREGLESILSKLNSEFENGLQECLSGTNGDANVQQLLSKVLDYVFKDLLLGNNVDESLIKEMRSEVAQRTFIARLKSYLKNIFPSLYILFGIVTLPEQPSKKTKDILSDSKLLETIRNAGNVCQMGVKDKNRNFKSDERDFAFSTLALFITEGYIPCLNLLTALLYELAHNKEIQDKARFSESRDNREDFLDITIKEALRKYPQYSIITRQCVKNYQFPESNITIDRKITINVPVDAIHKDEEYYKDANVFNPDRFLDDEAALRHCYTYLPFGAGPRKCIGKLVFFFGLCLYNFIWKLYNRIKQF